jgi:hypothetical protein
MENSRIEDTLDDTIEAFRSASDTPETGLDVDDSALLQLRKACRLLEAAASLREQNGYYTIIIEASFGAIERTLQFYLLDNGALHEEDFVTHENVYRMAESVGLYNQNFRDKLLGLWRNNRSRTYYREGVGSAKSATLMLELARGIHDHVLQLAGEKHECLCTS